LAGHPQCNKYTVQTEANVFGNSLLKKTAISMNGKQNFHIKNVVHCSKVQNITVT